MLPQQSLGFSMGLDPRRQQEATHLPFVSTMLVLSVSQPSYCWGMEPT